MNANAFSKKDYDNVIAFKPEKTNPKQSQSPPRSGYGQAYEKTTKFDNKKVDN
jgi:hypothetical protein